MNQPPSNEDDFIEPDDIDRRADQIDRIVRLAASLVKEGEPGAEYIPQRAEEFSPHPWVVTAVSTALEAGREQGRKEAEQEYRMLAEAMDETFSTRESHLIHTAIAAVLETIEKQALHHFDADGHTYVDIDMEAMRTITDRVKLRYQSSDGLATVRITLEPK